MIEAPPTILNLTDTGTRFEHLTDLQDAWAGAVEIKKASYYAFPTQADKLALAKFEAAVELIKKYIDALAKKDSKMFQLGREIDALPKRSKAEIAAETTAQNNQAAASQAVEPSAGIGL